MRAYPIFVRIEGFYSRRFQNMLASLRRFSRDEVASAKDEDNKVLRRIW